MTSQKWSACKMTSCDDRFAPSASHEQSHPSPLQGLQHLFSWQGAYAFALAFPFALALGPKLPKLLARYIYLKRTPTPLRMTTEQPLAKPFTFAFALGFPPPSQRVWLNASGTPASSFHVFKRTGSKLLLDPHKGQFDSQR